jgi:GNAT superfamily N-acetyltransferase
MPSSVYTIRNAMPHEYGETGQLLVDVYSSLNGFPTPEEQPAYYNMLSNVGELTKKPFAEILVAVCDDEIAGAVVYFGDMQYYGSGGTATLEKNAAGFRLLGVKHSHRGSGVGKLLTMECIRKAKESGQHQLIIHTTRAMQQAWAMYERIGFRRSPDLDFVQGDLDVFGFRMDM